MELIFWILLSYVLWIYIHEYAHLLALKRFVQVKSHAIKPYPHNHPELGFVFASVSCDYDQELTDRQFAWVSFAPRIPDALVLPLALFIPCSSLWWLVILTGGVVDLIRGSMTGRETADVRRYSEGFKMPLRAVLACQYVYALCCLLAIAGRVYG